MLGKTEGRKTRTQRAWDGWTVLSAQWTWVWASFSRQWDTEACRDAIRAGPKTWIRLSNDNSLFIFHHYFAFTEEKWLNLNKNSFISQSNQFCSHLCKNTVFLPVWATPVSSVPHCRLLGSLHNSSGQTRERDRERGKAVNQAQSILPAPASALGIPGKHQPWLRMESRPSTTISSPAPLGTQPP